MIQPIRDKSQTIQHLHPHYTDDRFKHMQTVYLAQGHKLDKNELGEYVSGASCNYSDRLRQWDYDKADAAWKQAREQHNGQRDTAAVLETYLQLYFDKPDLVLVHVKAGFSWSNGHPYQLFEYFPEGVPA